MPRHYNAGISRYGERRTRPRQAWRKVTEEPAVEHRYSLAHLTVLSLTPPEVVDVAARTGYGYASLRITRVTSEEPLYDLARDPALMRATKARLRDTGIAVHDVELFRMDA
jgi:hypothetical protein